MIRISSSITLSIYMSYFLWLIVTVLYAVCIRGRFVFWVHCVVCHRLKDELQSTANASLHK